MRVLIFSVSRTMSKPATRPEPDVGASRPQSMRIVVDLPAPLGPRKPKDLAAAHGERNAGDGLERAKTLLEVLHLDDGFGWAALLGSRAHGG
jgi:hypothetical protein